MGHLQYPRGGDIVAGTLYFIQLNLKNEGTHFYTLLKAALSSDVN